MQVGLTILSPAGGITVLARALFVIVLLCLAVPAVAGVWVSLQRRTKRDSESGEALDLDALPELYERGEISWDEFLRGEVEGVRGLSGVEGVRGLIEKAKEERSSNSTANEEAS